MVVSLAGCLGTTAPVEDVREDLQLAPQDEITYVANAAVVTVGVDDTSASDNPLAGTCPRGQHCGSPHCALWVDLDNDSHCDRGE